MGYLAEMDGDRETADYFYSKAQQAERADDKVGIATRKEAEGKPLMQVAATSTEVVATRMQRDLEAKRRQGGPVVLRKRSGEAVVEPAQPKRPTRREGTDVVSIPIPRANESFTPENAAPATTEPATTTPAVEQPQAQQPQSQQPQVQEQPEEPQLVTPQELEQPPNPTTSSEPPN
jgi:hypothetical protein